MKFTHYTPLDCHHVTLINGRCDLNQLRQILNKYINDLLSFMKKYVLPINVDGINEGTFKAGDDI
jgi:hypothetical protein